MRPSIKLATGVLVVSCLGVAAWLSIQERARPVDPFARIGILLAGGIAVVYLGISRWVVRVRLRRLGRVMEQLAEQAVREAPDLPLLPEEHADEIGALEAGFNRMSRAVRQAHDLLEKRVVERTELLVHANQALGQEVLERRRAEEVARQAHATAEAANAAKSQFLANVSHEIRTPMNGILGMTELALDTPLNSEQREYLQTVHSSAEALLTILNDILDFSKMEAGKLELDPQPFALRELIAGAIKTLSARAQVKGLRLAHEVDPAVTDTLVGDGCRLRQILVNLVGNAIKFTSSGEVIIRVGLQPPEAVLPSRLQTDLVPSPCFQSKVCHLHFAVADTGIGIPADKFEAIFQPFVQADGTTARRFGGTGLGLSISARLVERMGGRIWVESKEGQGSTFHFTACLGVQTCVPRCAPPVHPTPVVAAPRDSGPLRILLAEDNVVNQRLAVRVLEKHGHCVVVVEDGAEAVRRVAQERFDLVLMDVQMPQMDGYEATACIRAREAREGGHLPIVAMTANAMKGDREICMRAGMDGYVAKPIQARQLFEVLAGVLARSALEAS